MASSSSASDNFGPMDTETPAPSLHTQPASASAATANINNTLHSIDSTADKSRAPRIEDVNATTEDATAGAGGGDDEEKRNESLYECTICLETAKDAVVSLCGHLFCWPCLHQWLETRPTRQLCPVCKAAISKDKVIPLYGRDSKNQQDPRNKVPPRPVAQRVEPEPNMGFQGFGFPEGGFHMSFGIGAFPFGFFTSSFNFGSDVRPPNASDEEQFLSKLFLWVGILFLAWLILA